MRTILVIVAAVAATAFAGSAVASPGTQITIRHQMQGCHTWAVGSSAFKASQSVAAQPRTTFVLTNNDVMPHTLVQLGGPRVALAHAKLAHMGASTRFTLRATGVYTFKTKPGEDYPGMGAMKTIGADNVLRLRIVVK
jgi:plastocyanin